jgi:hypothetical protein
METEWSKDLPLPGVTVGCFRDDFFFSFFGLIVSVLGLAFNVPLSPSDLPHAANAGCGILATVSVSTVMACVDPSCLGLAGFEVIALDCLVTSEGGAADDDRRASDLALLPSLPLSCAARDEKDLSALESWSAVSE